MKVLPFKHLFDAQHVVPLSGEPLEIATTLDGLFLVATTTGIQVYNIPTSNTIDSEDNPNYGLIYSIPSVNKEITSLAYVPATDCIATLEKETDRSVISVARIYYNWRSNMSKLAKQIEQTPSVETTKSSHEKSEHRSLQVETIPSASSLICIAACPFTDKIVVATRSEISVWATTTTIKGDDSDHILCIPQKIFDVDLSVSPSAVCKLSLINQFLCYSTLSDVHVVRVITSLLQDSSDSTAHGNQIDTNPTDNQTIVEDEFYFECNFEDGGMQQFQLSLPSLASDQNERRDQQQKFSTDIPSAIRSEFRMQSQIRANKESGYQILSSNLVFYQTFEKNTDNVNRVEQNVHTAILLPEFSLTDSRLDLTNFRAPTSATQQATLSSIPVSRLRCVISTQQKGYIYDIAISQQNVTSPELVATYTYSAPTIAASCSNFLYTLSETGLEIYTLRCKEFGEFGDLEGQSSVSSPTTVNSAMNTYPGPCLVSIQSFIGLCRIEVVPFTDVLLLICKEPEKSRSRSASISGQSSQPQQKAGGWNLYVLTSTSVHTLYEEIISQAEGYHESNPSVYYQLVLEMHLLLRSKLGQLNAQLKSSQRRPTSSSSPSLLNLLLESKNFHDLYRKSSGLLADFYFDHGDYRKSSRFYCLSWRPLSQVLNKMVQAPKNALSHVLEYLDFVLFSPEQAEVLDEDDNLATKIVYYYQQSPTKLSNVVLHSNLKGYPKPLVLEMLEKRKNISTNKRESQAESQKMIVKDCFARAILYYQTSQLTKAILEISALNSEMLIDYIQQHASLVAGNLDLSSAENPLTLVDAGIVIGVSQPWTFLEALTNVSWFESIHAEQKVLIGWHLLTQLKSKILAFQPSFDLCLLELCYLEWSLEQTQLKPDNSHITSKLVELYLMAITSPTNQQKEEKSQSIYERKWREYHENMLWNRPLWLNGLPPFNSQQIDATFGLYMKKLQGILTHHNFQTQECIKLIAQNILNQKFDDQNLLSLQLLALAVTGNLEQSLHLLLELYSHVLLDFSKQFCIKIDDWKITIWLLSQNENYKTQLQEILQYLATILQPNDFMKVIPQNGDVFFYLIFLESCIQLQEANLLRKQLTTSFLNVNVE